MQRIPIDPRNNWQKEVEKIGFGFHSLEVPYWDESACYSLSLSEVSQIENSTIELWDMCLKSVQHVIDNKLYARFGIPDFIIPHIEKSWDQDVPSIYGRFDFSYNEGKLKLLEFNADTPTSLYESGIVQWYWLQDFNKNKDQFNSIHEKLTGYWKYLVDYLNKGTVHFSCVKESLEDLTTTEYMRDCAMQAGLETKLIFIEDIGWDENEEIFADMENEPISNLFKLYPWEFLLNEGFGKNIPVDKNQLMWIEPSWKMILSNKAILAILWELYPDHPNLLRTHFDLPSDLKSYAKKPFLSREGSNISLMKDGQMLENSTGEYDESKCIYQELFELPAFRSIEGNNASKINKN